MRAVYVTVEDPQDVHAWSGLVYHIGHSLEAHAEVAYAGPLPPRRSLPEKLKQKFCEALSGKRHKRGREAWLLKYYARLFEPRVAATGSDAVLACSSFPIAYLQCEQPVFMWVDSTFAGLIDYHPDYFDLCSHTIAIGNAAEQHALDRCARVIFASEWAARIAQESYGLPAEKVAVVPFGSNLDIVPSATEVRADVRRRSKSVCRLLLVGVDWHWKGADVAIAATAALRAAGVAAELTIVGCQMPPGTALPEWVRVTGFISKKSEEGRSRLSELYRETHFFLFPTRADCYGVVVAEANSFGIPVIASKTGGIPISATGLNGTMFGLDRYVAECVEYIAAHWNNAERYIGLAETSRNEFDTRLNWSVSGSKVAEILRECVENRRRDVVRKNGGSRAGSCGA